MICEDYKIMIQDFTDRELEKGKEIILFTHLSSCEECRDYMKNLNLLSSFSLQDKAMYPLELDSRILREVEKRTSQRKAKIGYSSFIPGFNASSAVLYALTVLLIVTGIFIFSRLNQNERKLQEAMKQIDYQKQNIEAIINSMPEVEVKPVETNQIIINAKL